MLILLIAAVLSFDAKMSEEELQTTGVSELSIPERKALHEWIEDHYEKKIIARNKQKGPELQDNLKGGRYIRLTDNSLWKIDPCDTPITQSWVTQVVIKVSESDHETYPYVLTNSLTGSSVRAQRVKELSNK